MPLFPFSKRTSFLGMTIAATLLGAVATAHGQAFQWKGGGTSPNDPTDPTNYATAAVPTYGANNTAGSFWLKQGSSTMTYSSAQGTTTFSGTGANSLTWIDWNSGGGTGGTTGQSTVQVTGGTLNLNGSFSGDSNTYGLWVGNSTTSTGAFLTINGGTVGVANGTNIGRDGSTGTLSITSGSFSTGVCSSAVGMYIGSAVTSSTGNGTLTIGSGGQFTLAATATNPFMFGAATGSAAHTGTTDYINFTTGSTGKITLNLSGATLGANYFSTLVTNGFVQINGVTNTNLSSYAINTSTLSASTLALAVPEPSTWAMLGLGGLGLLVWGRRFRGAACLR